MPHARHQTGFAPRVNRAPAMRALQARFDAAQRIAAQAAGLAMQMRPPAGAAQATLKGAQDWLTAADGAVERFLSTTQRSAPLRWVVDPIDGTSNFARGAPRWCVSLALLDGDAPVIGVLAAPALNEAFTACTGRGATLNGAPIRAAGTTALSRAIIEAGWSPRVDLAGYQALCARIQAAGAMLRNGGSGALGLADVAAGRMDGYAELHINLWDCAAALVILAEAGAAASHFLPRGLQGEAPILAAAPGVADALTAVAMLT